MIYTTANRLATYNGQSITHDADGNLTSGPLAGALTNFTYDSRNRLTAAGTTTYTYDGENRRVGVTAAGATTRYAISPHAALDQALVRTDAQGNQTYYVYGLGLIGQQDDQGNYKTYHYDLRGSTVALTDISGNVTDRYQYAPYGELVYSSGTTDTPFLFNGRDGVMTDDNGLYYLRARYYNPGIKRFIGQDVVVGSIDKSQSLNRYAYANGQPVSMVDPFGLAARDSDMKLSDKVQVFVVGATETLLGDDIIDIGKADNFLIPVVVVVGGITYVIVKATEDVFENSKGVDEVPSVPNVKYPGNDPTIPPSPDYEWRGKGEPGSKEGSWYNPKTKETMHPDLAHPEPIGRHWDYVAPDGKKYRVNPDGSVIPK